MSAGLTVRLVNGRAIVENGPYALEVGSGREDACGVCCPMELISAALGS